MKDIMYIAKYLCLSLYELIRRNAPEIKTTAAVLGEKAFLALDFWFTVLVELASIGLLALTLFIKWLYHTVFVQELIKATIQIVTAPIASTRAFITDIKSEMVSAWAFRADLIAEYAI